jgi:hypothetical protein
MSASVVLASVFERDVDSLLMLPMELHPPPAFGVAAESGRRRVATLRDASVSRNSTVLELGGCEEDIDLPGGSVCDACGHIRPVSAAVNVFGSLVCERIHGSSPRKLRSILDWTNTPSGSARFREEKFRF